MNDKPQIEGADATQIEGEGAYATISAIRDTIGSTLIDLVEAAAGAKAFVTVSVSIDGRDEQSTTIQKP